jgi:aryl-alcohol dehydrogenase-like predicted oxidoreductase
MVPNETMQKLWEQAALDDLLDGMSRGEFMLRFTLSHPALDTTIVGTANVDHLEANLRTAEQGPLPDEVLNEAKRRLDAAASPR